MDRVDAWRLFLLVAELGSFSEAARRAGVSAGQVSKQIAALEKSLEVRLFERTTRAVRATAEGTEMVERARALIEAADALAAPGEGDGALTGTIRISAPVIYGTRTLAPAIVAFLEQHPGLNVRLILADRRVDLVNEGFDLALRIGEMSDGSLVGRKLQTQRLRLMASPDFLARHGPIRSPQDLARVPCLIDLNVSLPRQWRLVRNGQVETVRVDGRFETDSAEVIREACLKGLGVGLIPEFCVDGTALTDAEGGLVDLLPDWTTPEREAWLLWPPGRYLAPRTRALVDHLVDALKARRR